MIGSCGKFKNGGTFWLSCAYCGASEAAHKADSAFEKVEEPVAIDPAADMLAKLFEDVREVLEEHGESAYALKQTQEVLELLKRSNLLRPKPWPPIPYPEDVKHQLRWSIQRAHEEAWFRTGSQHEGHIAAAETLLANGWTPPTGINL